MSTRAQRAALRAYPRDYRAERGAEILTTLEDMGPAGRGHRQTLSLLAGGVRTRAGLAGGWHPQGVAAQGLRIGAFLIAGGYALVLLGLAWQQRAMHPTGLALLAAAWTAAAVVVLRPHRLAGAWAVAAAAAAELAWVARAGLHGGVLWFSFGTLAAIAGPCLAALIAAHRLGVPTRRVAPWWLLGVLPQALLLSGVVSGFFISSAVLAVSVPLVLLALAVAPLDPRPAVAGCVVLTAVVLWLATASLLGIYTWTAPMSAGRLLALAAPGVLLVAAATAGLRRLASPV